MKIKKIIQASGIEPKKVMLNLAVKIALFEVFEAEKIPAKRHQIVKEISELTGLSGRAIYYHFNWCRNLVTSKKYQK